VAKPRSQKSGKATEASEDIVDAVVVEEEPKPDVADAKTDQSAVAEGADSADAKTEGTVVTDAPQTVSGSTPDDAPTDTDRTEAAQEASDAPEDSARAAEADTAAETDMATPAPAEISEERSEATAAPDPTAPPTAQKPARKSGFVPLVLGGIVAGAVGFGAGSFVNGWPFGQEEDPFKAQTSRALSDQSALLSEISGRVDGLATTLNDTSAAVAAIDLGPVAAQAQAAQTTATGLETALNEVRGKLSGFETRITELEKRPMEAAVSPETIAAYERELDKLRSDITAQRDEIKTMAAEAFAAEQAAGNDAVLAKARAALADITVAVDNGAPFADALAQLRIASGATIPEGLSAHAADGVPTLAALIASFPDAARSALAASRMTGDTGEGGFGAFLKAQLGARSVTPKEGNDPDAVLSRAEAALRSGDLTTTLSELDALPDVAQKEIADWRAGADARASALAAVALLGQDMNKE